MSTAPVQGELVKANGAGSVEAAKPVAQLPSYIQGFEGAASAPFPAEALAVLGAPVNPSEVEIKPNGIVFLPGVSYRRILTRAFGAGAWALLPRGPARMMGNEVVYPGALYILGRFVSEAVGECASNNGGMSYASALEGARTDCLTRCCKDLGVAAELWDPEWRTAWQAKFCKKEFKDGKPKWSKLDTGEGGEPTGRNVGTPKGPVASELELALQASLAQVQKERVADAPKGAAPPSFEAPTEGEVNQVRAAIKALGWAAPKARAWALQNFGVGSANALSKDQAASALALLLAAKLDDDDAEYSRVYDRLKAAGRVL